jgi:hypothetical protein
LKGRSRKTNATAHDTAKKTLVDTGGEYFLKLAACAELLSSM